MIIITSSISASFPAIFGLHPKDFHFVYQINLFTHNRRSVKQNQKTEAITKQKSETKAKQRGIFSRSLSSYWASGEYSLIICPPIGRV
jgi:hypothetical protein